MRTIQLESVHGDRVDDDVTLAASEMHVRAILQPPWCMNLPVGMPSDAAAGETTVCAYLNMFRRSPNDLWVLMWDVDDVGNRKLFGFTVGRLFDRWLRNETKMDLGALVGGPFSGGPQPGDYYFALTTIEGPESPSGVSYRGKRIRGKSMFWWSVRQLVGHANQLGSPRFWVRTHASEAKVQGVCADLGCVEVARQTVVKSGSETQRVVMAKERCDRPFEPELLIGPFDG